jgi:hypothetical protein
VPPELGRHIGRGADLLREVPGSRSLLGGAAVTGMITLVLHPPGRAAVMLRVMLAMAVIVLFLAMSGELGRVRQDARRMRALLGSARSRRGPLSRRRHLLLAGLCAVLGVSRQPRGASIARDARARQETGSRPREKGDGTRGRATRVRAGRRGARGQHAPHRPPPTARERRR